MPRVTYVKSGKKPRRCSGCGGEIPAGAPYKWFKIKLTYGGMRRDFCTNCTIRPSMMTLSPHRSGILSAQEAAEDALSEGLALADVAQIVRDYGEAIREVGQGYEESAQNIEDGFGHETYQSEELKEKAEACESFADECDDKADEIENLDDPDASDDDFKEDFDGETDDDDEPLDEEEWQEYLANARDERRTAAYDAAQEVVYEEPEV